MKKLIFFATVILESTLAMAQPTTAPADSAMKVLLVPFKQIGDPGTHAWVGQAIQENLISDTSANPATQAVGLNHPLANVDSHDAQQAARDAGASIVVFGSYQLSSDQLRVTGQAMDAGSGRVLATLQSTGPVTDLFKIEDTLSSQLSAALPQPPPSDLAQVSYGPNSAAVPTASVPDASATAAAAPQAYDASQAYQASSPTYVYPQTTYVYPSYGYSYAYPYYYPYTPFYFGFGGWGGGWRGGWRGGGWGHGFIGPRGGGHFSGGGHFGGHR